MPRRSFMQLASGAGCLPALASAGALATQPDHVKNCVVIHMEGAPSHTDTFDLKTGAWTPAAFRPIRESAIAWPAGLFPELSRQLGDIALVRGIRSDSVIHEKAIQPLLIGMPLIGKTSFADACSDARALLRSGRAPGIIRLSSSGWDRHANLYGTALDAANPNSSARRFDAAVAKLIRDLRSDGLLDQTLIVAMGEFGRTTGPLNHQGGRDHHPVMAAMFAGAKLRGGTVLRATEETGTQPLGPQAMSSSELLEAIQSLPGQKDGAVGTPISALWA